MKTRLLILIIALIAITIFTITFERRYEAISAFYHSTQISDKENLCYVIRGKWDSGHNTCDNVEDVKCLAIGGEPLTKPNEWRCPEGIDNCVMEAMNIATCHFENEK